MSTQEQPALPLTIKPGSPFFRSLLPIRNQRTCECKPNHINCMTAKEWIKAQIGIWQFAYEKRDIRDKKLHPATFPISLAKQVIRLFTHEGQIVVDPFVGSGTTLVAAQDLSRNAIGFDLQEKYVDLCAQRLQNDNLFNTARQIAIQDDALHIPHYFQEESISLIWTSPPYANLLNRKRKNKSRRGAERKNEQFGQIEQYSQDPRDLGTMSIEEYTQAMGAIFERLLPCCSPRGIASSTFPICGGKTGASPFTLRWSKNCESGAMNYATSSFGTARTSSIALAFSAGPPTTSPWAPHLSICSISGVRPRGLMKLYTFDARSGHNHGTKFRLRADHLPALYACVTEV